MKVLVDIIVKQCPIKQTNNNKKLTMGCTSSKDIDIEKRSTILRKSSSEKILKNNEKQINNREVDKTLEDDIDLYSEPKFVAPKEPPKPKPTYAVHSGSYNAKLGNESECWLRGAVFLASGALVVTDYKNNKLKMFDRTFKYVSDLELPSGVWGVCVSTLNIAEVFATVPYKKEVHKVLADPESLTALDSFRTEGFCWGITCFNGGLAVSVKVPSKPLVPPFQVHLVEFDGTLKRSIAFDADGVSLFTEPKFLAATHDGAFLLISDYKKDCLYCLNVEDKVIFTYTGMKSPSGVAVDSNNNIHLVSFFGTERIHKLNTRGEKLNGLPPDEERTLFPHGICYRKKDKLLLVTTDSDKMEAYALV